MLHGLEEPLKEGIIDLLTYVLKDMPLWFMKTSFSFLVLRCRRTWTMIRIVQYGIPTRCYFPMFSFRVLLPRYFDFFFDVLLLSIFVLND